MPVLNWACCILILFFLCACSTTSQVSSDPQGKVRTADVPDTAAKKAVKNGRTNGSSTTVARSTDVKVPEKTTGLGPGFSGVDPSGKPPENRSFAAETGVPASGQTVKTNGNNGQDNADTEIEEDVDEIVALLRLAQAYRDKGDMDNALKSLDKAYGMLLSEDEETSVVVREKDDLRLMIARKILEIYTGRRTAPVARL
ncbi:MAG TPA: tetratricopeptide repeat protein, partial [Syntrophales bacterium]